jgi:mannose-6-phosphate isomerase-like protein (cupin superfamily)
MVAEARLEDSGSGLTAVTDGWFAANVRDAWWMTNDAFGAACGLFEGDDAPFPEMGFTLSVLRPGQASGLYHRETKQENFLVLAGECILLVEGEERPLRAWDFVHCPPGTEHAFVGAGDGPCIIFACGARIVPGPGRAQPPGTIVYASSELARRHGAGAEVETITPAEAYAPFPRWGLGRPDGWDELPWV